MPHAFSRDRGSAARCARHRRCGRCGNAFDALARLSDTVPPARVEADELPANVGGTALAALPDAVVAAEYHFTADDLEKVFIDAQDWQRQFGPEVVAVAGSIPLGRPTTRTPSWWTRANPSRTSRSKARGSASRRRQGSTTTSSSRPTTSTNWTSSAWSRATSSTTRLDRRVRDPGCSGSAGDGRSRPTLDYLLEPEPEPEPARSRSRAGLASGWCRTEPEPRRAAPRSAGVGWRTPQGKSRSLQPRSGRRPRALGLADSGLEPWLPCCCSRDAGSGYASLSPRPDPSPDAGQRPARGLWPPWAAVVAELGPCRVRAAAVGQRHRRRG